MNPEAGKTGNKPTWKTDMDVSKNRGTPKWILKWKTILKMDDLGVPLFLETPMSKVFFKTF